MSQPGTESIRTVDYHTAGEPFRIVTSGVSPPRGETMLAKRAWAEEHLDRTRRMLVQEPRGHADMYGCFLTDPVDAGADLGVLFFHNAGFSTACGHGTIALVTWALESGRVFRPDGCSAARVVVDVPSGRLPTWASLEGGDVTSVRFRNVPSFVLQRSVPVVGMKVDIAYGGAFYAIAPAPVAITAQNLDRLVTAGREVKAALNARGGIFHPLEPALRDIYGVIWTQDDRNVTIFANGEVDRSPCGSGTSARLALLHATGELALGDVLKHRSIVKSEFTGRIVEETQVADLPAVVTDIEGSAHLTGRHEFFLEPTDPLGPGFLLR